MRTESTVFLSFFLVFALAFICVPGFAEIEEAEIIYAFPLDEGKGETAEDIGPNGLEAVLDRVDWDDGKFGEAVSLPGNGKVDIASDPLLSLSDTDFTLAIWTNYATDPPQGARGSQGFTLIGRDEGGGGTNKYIWWYSGAGIDFHVNTAGGGGVDWIDSDPWVPDLDVWYHWAIVREDDGYTQYLDGKAFGSMDAAAEIPEEINHDVTLGWSEGPFFFEGLLDEAFSSRQALSEDDVAKLAKLGITGALAVEPAGKLPSVWAAIKSSQ